LTSDTSGTRRLRRMSHDTPTRSRIPIQSRSDIHIADAVALAPNERGQKPMQAVEIGKREEQIAAKGLEPAAGVARAVAQHRSAHGIGDP